MEFAVKVYKFLDIKDCEIFGQLNHKLIVFYCRYATFTLF